MNVSDPLQLNDEKLKRTADVISALDSPLRLRILLLLQTSDHVVRELVKALDKSQPLISQHLRVLKKAGLVTATRSGREVVYSLASPRIIDIVGAVAEASGGLADREDRDELSGRRADRADNVGPDFIDATDSTGSAAASGAPPQFMPERDPGLNPSTPNRDR